MKKAVTVVSLLALVTTIAPSLLYMLGMFDHASVKVATLIGSAMWFIATPLWMGREVEIDEAIQTEF